eukprot:Awhi_evm2s14318
MSVLSELSISILVESFNALVLNYEFEEQVSVLDFYFSEINYSIDVLQDNSGIHSAENKLSAYHRLKAVLGGDDWDIVGIAMFNIEKYLLGLSDQVKGVVDYEYIILMVENLARECALNDANLKSDFQIGLV